MNTSRPKPQRSKRIAIISIFCLVGLVIAIAYWPGSPSLASAQPTSYNLPAPTLPSGSGVPTALNMGMPGGEPLAALQAPATAAHIDRFTLTAEPAQFKIHAGLVINGWGFNGSVPGPTLRVHQGDLVIVTLVNHLSFGVTIHWHGVRVPNSSDGVAGVTQNAVQSRQSYVYRFVALDAGTYWYHSHQLADAEDSGGLYGMLVVDPTTPTYHPDIDESVALHEWNGPNNRQYLAINNTTGLLNVAARPGQWVRLRIVNTSATVSSAPQVVTLVGAPFKVISLDGHDLNGPQWLTATPLPIGSAQRYDLFFQMPAHGTVALVTSLNNKSYTATPAVVMGQGGVPTDLPLANQPWFDLTSYGQPAPSPISLQSHFDATYNIVLDNQVGMSMGRSGMTYTLNGKVFPNTDMIMVSEGQIIRLHFDNQSNLYHPMHLHGHAFTVLSHNGRPLTGSPVQQDTVLVPPHESYDVAFVANNPGIWMLHCHNSLHANWGMDMMLMYNVSTPYTVGTQSGNFPD
jgi:FtsP/CotA-like multicopper oxidase with cupredoxin domain